MRASIRDPAEPLRRNQADARRVAKLAYPFQCCVVCGLQIPTCLTIAHLDHDPTNNSPDNLARLCQTHHWMFDAGLYPIEAIKLLRAHWQRTQGIPSHKARMKDAGVKAARARKRGVADPQGPELQTLTGGTGNERRRPEPSDLDG